MAVLGSWINGKWVAQKAPAVQPKLPAAVPVPAPKPAPAPAPAAPPSSIVTPAGQSAVDSINATFPWLAGIPGMADLIRGWAAEPNVTADVLTADLRNSAPYKAAFPGILNTDGTMKMNEAAYFAQRDQYKTILQNWSRGSQEYDQPSDFAAFFEQNMQPADLTQRLQTYDDITHGSSYVKSAFYVYAGMKLTDDQLYAAAVNPTDQKTLSDQYNAAVSSSPLDYATWIKRATEAGLQQVSTTLSNLESQGVTTGNAIDSVRRTDPAFAQQIADQLYHGGTGAGPFLTLEQLLHSFQYAMIGGAASQSGLDLPTTARLDALRQAGITAAQAQQGYGVIAEQAGADQGALDRMHSGKIFTTQDYEQALFLHQATDEQLLNQAQAGDKALTQAGGGAQIQQGQQGQVTQKGLAGRY